MPSRQSAGMPRIARERSITSARRDLGSPARWLRPSIAPDSASSVKPGRLAQGPEEKLALPGRVSGFGAIAICGSPFQKRSAPVGGRDPVRPIATRFTPRQ